MTPRKHFNDHSITNKFLFCVIYRTFALRLRKANRHANELATQALPLAAFTYGDNR